MTLMIKLVLVPQTHTEQNVLSDSGMNYYYEQILNYIIIIIILLEF